MNNNDYKASVIERFDNCAMKFDKPWEYSICENFLPNEIYENIYNHVSLRFNEDLNKRINVTDDDVRNILGGYFEVWEDNSVKESILNHLGVSIGGKEDGYWDKKSKFYKINSLDDTYIKILLRGFEPGFNYKVHTDMEKKICAIIIYISPKVDNEYMGYDIGTQIYSDKESYYGSVVWQENRALIFRQKKSHTWHAYSVPKRMRHHRYTLMINICTLHDKIKQTK